MIAPFLLMATAVAVRAADPDACRLLTAAELSSAIGANVGALKPAQLGAASFCRGEAPGLSIVLRTATRRGGPDQEAKGIEMLRKMGASIEVKKFGAMTCSAITPPPDKPTGYNTTCSVVKGEKVAAVEVTAKDKKDAVPIDRLRAAADKMVERF